MRGRAHVYAGARISADDIIPLRHQNGGAEEDLGAGIAAVVAVSFSRLFFRNALNNGFIVVECPEAVRQAAVGDLLEVDLRDAAVRNLTKGESYRFVPPTPFAMEILEAGGLLPYVLRQTTGDSSA